jgi:hypothetical protein
VRISTFLFAAVVAAALFVPAAARADGWLPHGKDDSWTYSWTDSVYQPESTIEKVTVKDGADAKQFTLAWTTDGQDSPSGKTSKGTVSLQQSTGGIENSDWSSNPPPSNFPVLCPQVAGCNNSVASAWYLVIWGGRSPVLAEPLLKGMSWSSTGAAQGDVTSSSQYMGTEKVKVPAFPAGVTAAKVRAEITQAGARGDPFGSGVRTTWWVYGVGPVKVVFEHTGGSEAPVTSTVLTATTLTPQDPPADVNYFPLKKGAKLTYRWTNSKYLTKPVIEQYTIDDEVNASARFSVKTLSGPIRAAGTYGFAFRLDGLTNLWGTTKAASLAKFPPLGPKALPEDKRRHFFTSFDLLTFGWNPVLPASPTGAKPWGTKVPSRDYSIYGVEGSAHVLGTQTVSVPAGTFKALTVVSSLQQKGFPFGSGTRTAWFAPGKGLVKLVFKHGDGSVSTVELIK